jgi:hypothetical protein
MNLFHLAYPKGFTINADIKKRQLSPSTKEKKKKEKETGTTNNRKE